MQHCLLTKRSCLTNFHEIFHVVNYILVWDDPVDIIYLNFLKSFRQSSIWAIMSIMKKYDTSVLVLRRFILASRSSECSFNQGLIGNLGNYFGQAPIVNGMIIQVRKIFVKEHTQRHFERHSMIYCSCDLGNTKKSDPSRRRIWLKIPLELSTIFSEKIL